MPKLSEELVELSRKTGHELKGVVSQSLNSRMRNNAPEKR